MKSFKIETNGEVYHLSGMNTMAEAFKHFMDTAKYTTSPKELILKITEVN